MNAFKNKDQCNWFILVPLRKIWVNNCLMLLTFRGSQNMTQRPLPVLKNNILLEHSPAHSFM